MVQSLTRASERDRPQRRRSVLLQVLEVNRGEGRTLTRRRSRSKFDEAELQRFGQQAGSIMVSEFCSMNVNCESYNCHYLRILLCQNFLQLM